MARVPPRRGEAAAGGRRTGALPDRSDARRTWKGPPYQRTPGRWSGAIDFAGAKQHVGTFDTPHQWGLARDALLVRLRDQRAARARKRSELDGVSVAGFVGAPGECWPWDFTKKGRRAAPTTFAHHEQ